MSDHLDQIMAIMRVAFDPAWGEAWNRRQVSDSLTMSHTHYRLLDQAGQVIDDQASDDEAAGFFLVRAAPGEEELLLVAVRPDQRGRGLGAALLEQFARDAAARGAKRIFLEMRENNPARTLYERCGFKPIGQRRDYYRTSNGGTMDAVTFARDL